MNMEQLSLLIPLLWMSYMPTKKFPAFQTAYSIGAPCPAHIPAVIKRDVYDISQMKNISEDDIVIFHGGEDISSAIYNKNKNKFNHGADICSIRDAFELECYDLGVAANAFLYGICRGAQLLCALAGGSLVQHTTGHGSGFHGIVDLLTGEKLKTNSYHHQMMYPFDLPKDEYIIIAKTDEEYLDEHRLYHGEPNELLHMPCEPEVVWFPTIRGFGVQGHPEWLDSHDNPFVSYVVNYMTDLSFESTADFELEDC